jgi:RNA recognition motif-containing protein
MAQKLFVGGLSFATTRDSLAEYFGQAGHVVSASVVTDQMTGQSRGFGFVEMATAEEAQQAVTQLNGREFEGRPLKVEVAKPKTEGSRGGGFNRGGGRGGWR